MKTTCFSIAVAFLLIFSLSLFACKKESVETLPTDPVPINLSTDQVALIESESSFAFDIFRKVVEKAGVSENVIISPLSISYALSMTLNGANGTTRNSMLEALRVNGISPEIINNSYKNLSEALLNVDSRILISIANSVWTEKNFVVKKPFTGILTGFYNAESKSFDITDPHAPDAMNSWIENKTNGLIKNMIDKLNDNSVMLLINAIYYKGKWKSQFDAKNTVQRSFNKPGGVSVVVPMMKQTDDFKVFTGGGFSVAEFPYGQGNFVMDVILPDDHNGVNGIIPLLNNSNLKTWLNQMGNRETDLSFPRFKYGYKKQLKDVLTDMGMGVAFSIYADFSNISDRDLLINDVTHQAFIETNEEGTEAAAATIVDIGVTSLPVGRLTLSIDHSFIYIIREITTNTILFMGRVADPLAN
jgi:serine protease inhibitor